MSCFHQLTAYQREPNTVPLFNKDRFSVYEKMGYKQLKLPCRQCVGCRVAHEVEWSIRMMHEASLHDDNHFVTLTYDDKHLPWDNSLNHIHVQKFIRALRKKTKQKIRYFAAGEYGENFSRPHYHLILFGLKLTDLQRIGPRNHMSDLLADVWGKGFVDVGESVTRATCVYVAGYMLKDVNKEWENDWAWPHEQTGEVRPRAKPYARMSNRPGIGKKWYDKYGNTDVFPQDFVIHDGKKYPSPAYYRRLLEREQPELFVRLKEKREAALETETFKSNNTPERLAVRENVHLLTQGNKTDRSSRKKGLSLGGGKFKNSAGVTAAELSLSFVRASK